MMLDDILLFYPTLPWNSYDLFIYTRGPETVTLLWRKYGIRVVYLYEVQSSDDILYYNSLNWRHGE